MKNTRKLTHIGLMTALVAVMAQISIPMPMGVPITLQVFAVALSGFILKRRLGLLSMAVYILIGAVGVPVFANFQGGLGVLMSVTGGFIAGFLPIAFFCGISIENKLLEIFCLILSVFICHICGVLWFSYILSVPIWTAFLEASAWYLAKDILLVFAARYVANAIKKRLG